MHSLFEPAMKSLERETFPESLLGIARTFELASKEVLSNLLMPLAPPEDPGLQKRKFQKHIMFYLLAHKKQDSKHIMFHPCMSR